MQPSAVVDSHHLLHWKQLWHDVKGGPASYRSDNILVLYNTKLIRRRGTHIHAVSEDAEPLDPLQELRNCGHFDKQATEDHHADPDEGGQDGAD